MENTTVLICLATIAAIILILPLLLMLAFRNRMAAFNRLANLLQMRNAAAQTPPQIQVINTRTTTIWTVVYIIFSSLISLMAFYLAHQIVDKKVKPVSVNWIKSDSLKIKPGPVWFYYDKKNGTLNTRHAISDNDKTQLTALINDDDKVFQSYSLAIDQLAFTSNRPKESDIYFWLTILYAIAGLLGVQLRTINNFIGIACYKKTFDFHAWWPWYLVRPLLGFITGGVVFLLIDSKQLLAGESAGGMSALALTAAFLGGFSADEFYELLRKISKRILGG
jgi:hypothetical protein